MSRAERRIVPPPPRVGRSMRGAVEDFYYNSWRFLGANMIVGVLLVAAVLLGAGSLATLAALPLIAVPTAGIMRMATCLQREGHTDFSDFWDVVRHPARPIILGAFQAAAVLVLVVNVLVGASWATWLGTFFVVTALYGFALVWAYGAVAWTLVMDPERDGESTRRRLKLALVILVAHPMRLLAFLLLAGTLLLAASLLIAPLLTFAIGLVWLAIARYILPVADRVEARPTMIVEEGA